MPWTYFCRPIIVRLPQIARLMRITYYFYRTILLILFITNHPLSDGISGIRMNKILIVRSGRKFDVGSSCRAVFIRNNEESLVHWSNHFLLLLALTSQNKMAETNCCQRIYHFSIHSKFKSACYQIIQACYHPGFSFPVSWSLRLFSPFPFNQ